jgi:hypothetical protein
LRTPQDERDCHENVITPPSCFRNPTSSAVAARAAGTVCAAAGCVTEPEVTPIDLRALLGELSGGLRADYTADGDGGLAHTTYFTIKPGSPEHAALPKSEQDKLAKIQAGILHSSKLPPTDLVAGTEVTGTLTAKGGAGSDRIQEVVLKLPKKWNGQLVVVGSPGTRTEFASEAVIATWVLKRGFAYVSGNKGLTNGGADGNTSLLRKQHATQHYGAMMLDLAGWAQRRLLEASGKKPSRTYALGLSMGGYQVRRALELDHEAVEKGAPRLFDGGIEWAGVYAPDARVLDSNRDGKVSTTEFSQGTHLVTSMERAVLAMGYPYDTGAKTTPAAYRENAAVFGGAGPDGRGLAFIRSRRSCGVRIACCSTRSRPSCRRGEAWATTT